MEKPTNSLNQRPLRILYLIHGVDIGDQSGGAELHAIRVARLLNRAEFTPAVFCMWQFESETEKKWLEILKQENISVFGLNHHDGSLAQNLRNVLKNLWSTVSFFSPDIIHSHSERGDWMNSIIRIFHPKHPHAVRTVHIDQQWKTQPIIGSIINNLIFPFTFDYETTVSQTIYNILNTKLRRKKKIGVCYNGIDESAFTYQPANQDVLIDTLPVERPCLGIVGRLTDQKGHVDLLEAMKIVHGTVPVHLLIIGGGPLETTLKEQSTQLGLQDFVHFLGIRQDVDDILLHLDLFVLPSYWEGFPTVLLEAMSKNVPIVATDVSGSCELIQTGNTGLLVPPKDPKHLAEAILYMLNSPSEVDMMVKQANQLARQYTIQNAAFCYAIIYKMIAPINPKVFN